MNAAIGESAAAIGESLVFVAPPAVRREERNWFYSLVWLSTVGPQILHPAPSELFLSQGKSLHVL